MTNVFQKMFFGPTIAGVVFLLIGSYLINNVSAQDGIPITCVPNNGVKFEGVDSDKLIVSQNNVPLAVVYVSGYMPRPPYNFKFFGPELCDRGANSILMIKGGFYRATFIKYFEPPTLGDETAFAGQN